MRFKQLKVVSEDSEDSKENDRRTEQQLGTIRIVLEGLQYLHQIS